MSNKKQKKDLKRRQKKKREQQKKPGVQVRGASVADARSVEIDIHHEIHYITELAQAGEARLVTLGSFVLFSTESGNAWLLDAEDCLALSLMRGGKPQPIHIAETPESILIAWNAKYEISGDAFIITDRLGNVTSILGDPSLQIAQACIGQVE